jgi:hypothetical protein
MVYFHAKTPNASEFWSAFEWKMLVYFMTILVVCGHFLYCMAVWYTLWSFGIFFPLWYVWTNLATLVKTSYTTLMILTF